VTDELAPPSHTAAARVVIGATFAIAAVGAVCAVLTLALPAPVIPMGVIHLPWWPLMVMFALVMSIDIMIMVRREALMLNLTEVPLVLGLMFATPMQLFIGRLVGTLISHVIYRRQYREPLKMSFNLAWTCEAFMATAIFRFVMNGHAIGDWRSWVGAYAAAVFVAILSAFVVSIVIAYVEGTTSTWPFARMARHALAEAVIMTTLGVVCAQALFGNKWSAVPLVGLGAAVWVAYRAYGVLHERHLSLERLYRFSQVVSHSPDVTEVLRRILEQAKAVLQADYARVTFLPSETIDGLDMSLPASRSCRRRTC